jgi:hypothetical protein
LENEHAVVSRVGNDEIARWANTDAAWKTHHRRAHAAGETPVVVPRGEVRLTENLHRLVESR